MTIEEVKALIAKAALPMDEMWELVESFTEIDYEEFVEMWQEVEDRRRLQ